VLKVTEGAASRVQGHLSGELGDIPLGRRAASSSALYPLWKMRDYAVELIRFAFYLEVNWQALAVVLGCLAVFLGLSVWAYDPAFGIQQRKAGAAVAA
jgi:hypothetical protein